MGRKRKSSGPGLEPTTSLRKTRSSARLAGNSAELQGLQDITKQSLRSRKKVKARQNLQLQTPDIAGRESSSLPRALHVTPRILEPVSVGELETTDLTDRSLQASEPLERTVSTIFSSLTSPYVTSDHEYDAQSATEDKQSAALFGFPVVSETDQIAPTPRDGALNQMITDGTCLEEPVVADKDTAPVANVGNHGAAEVKPIKPVSKVCSNARKQCEQSLQGSAAFENIQPGPADLMDASDIPNTAHAEDAEDATMRDIAAITAAATDNISNVAPDEHVSLEDVHVDNDPADTGSMSLPAVPSLKSHHTHRADELLEAATEDATDELPSHHVAKIILEDVDWNSPATSRITSAQTSPLTAVPSGLRPTGKYRATVDFTDHTLTIAEDEPMFKGCPSDDREEHDKMPQSDSCHGDEGTAGVLISSTWTSAPPQSQSEHKDGVDSQPPRPSVETPETGSSLFHDLASDRRGRNFTPSMREDDYMPPGLHLLPRLSAESNELPRNDHAGIAALKQSLIEPIMSSIARGSIPRVSESRFTGMSPVASPHETSYEPSEQAWRWNGSSSRPQYVEEKAGNGGCEHSSPWGES